MTHEHYANSAHPSATNDPIESLNLHQYAPDETQTTMSSHGPEHGYHSINHRLSGGWIVHDDQMLEGATPEASLWEEEEMMAPEPAHRYNESYPDQRPTKRARTTFYEFAAHARLQQHHERRQHFLATRKRVLQKSTALLGRLRRTNSWVQDGLVEISKHQDPTAFARVYSHAQDLVDACVSHWNNELSNLDSIQSTIHQGEETSQPESFFDRLPKDAQQDLLELLSNLRGNPRFLIDRLRNLPRSQAATLTGSPKWQFSDSFLNSFSQESGRTGSQRRRQLQTYASQLEDYSRSFERSNPLSFLLHNLYSHDVHPDSKESKLRLYNWSTICAELMRCRAESYTVLYWQALEAFSIMQEWPAKTRIELFLMDVLQRGAFLINENPLHRGKAGYNPLSTDAAQEFFEEAVHELYWTLIDCKQGCYPPGALELAQAILDKLPSEQLQSDFRNHFISEWYFGHFLKTAIMYPENENMLLKMHVSKRAREHILAPIYNRFLYKFENHADSDIEEDLSIRGIIGDMIGMLDGLPATDPYHPISEPSQTIDATKEQGQPTIVLCASEIVKVIEILSPQTLQSSYGADPLMRELSYAFQANSKPTTRFDMLKQHLMQQLDPGTSTNIVHPCLEAWAEFSVQPNGQILSNHSPTSAVELGANLEVQGLTQAQKAAIRLCNETLHPQETGLDVQWTHTTPLVDLFRQKMDLCQAETRSVDALYWKRAHDLLIRLDQRYSFGDETADSIILNSLVATLESKRATASHQCSSLQNQLALYEVAYRNLKNQSKRFISGLEELRLKLWYTSQVIKTNEYLSARNIAAALSHMALPKLQATTSIDRPFRDQWRPTTSRSSRSSIFGELPDATMQVLKAPTEHGGPRKLADPQIESIKAWIQQNSIDNFCKGEERLHRFCMAVQTLTKKLTGDTALQSPDLWTSELFARESISYDVHSGISSAPASTRPTSIYSENLSTTFSFGKPTFRSSDSDVRSTMSDERDSLRRPSVYNHFQTKLNRELLSPELASSIGSVGRSSSANTNASEIFSYSAPSVTSASVYSGTPSFFYGKSPNLGTRPVIAVREKRQFRDQLQKGLVCLLLSDLGSLVWSWGCETDTWMKDVQLTGAIADRCAKRMHTNQLYTPSILPIHLLPRRPSATSLPIEDPSRDREQDIEDQETLEGKDLNNYYMESFRDVVVRLSKQVDPVGKLQACVELHTLAVQLLQLTSSEPVRSAPLPSTRRRSVNDMVPPTFHGQTTDLLEPSLVFNEHVPERQVVNMLGKQLALIKPLTIFRDLQFIAVFAPPELLDRKADGEAFIRVGMAAMEYKNELCHSMVEVAHQMVAADLIKRQNGNDSQTSLAKAAEYWKIAALEGNAVGQRELAMLYLVHPEMLPVVTLPLSMSGDIFRDDMMWQQNTRNNENRQALCLALHWMQLAARNRDEIAQRKLAERNEQELSIR